MKSDYSIPAIDDSDDAPEITAERIIGAKRRVGLTAIDEDKWRESVNERLGKL